MKTSIMQKYGLFFVPIITVMMLILAMPVTAFSTENVEGGSSEIGVAPLSGEPNDSGEADSQNNVTEPTAEGNIPDEIPIEGDITNKPANDETLVDEGISENPEGQENVVEPIEETPVVEETPIGEALIEEAPVDDPSTEEGQLSTDITIPGYETVHYNAIYLGGLNILNNNWDHITVTVTNEKTCTVQEGYLTYHSNSALFGYLTSGSHTDTNNTYNIEVRIYMPDGQEVVIYGFSTGTAGNGDGYFTISFMTEGNTTIGDSEVEILDPLVPLVLPEPAGEAGLKENPRTYDTQITYFAIYLLPTSIALAIISVCLLRYWRHKKAGRNEKGI